MSRIIAALLLILSAVSCGLGWGESAKVAQPDDTEDLWVAPDAEADGDSLPPG